MLTFEFLQENIKPYVVNGPKALHKQKVRDRDNYTCQFCLRHVPPNPNKKMAQQITVDHFMPRSLGGRNTMTNLYCACYHCNQAKGNEVFATFQEAQLFVLLKRNMIKKLKKIGYDMEKN
jgi:5-methylcytosine-specific restriction endonuclease McrA